MDVHDIDKVEFGILSAEDIKRMAVCKVDSTKLSGPGTVYDERMGCVLDTNNKCVTCGLKKDCWGHFGYIELVEPILHPMYLKIISAFLKCFCKQCNRLLLLEEQIELSGLTKYKREKRFKKILEKLEKIDICSHEDCSYPQPKVVYKSKDATIALEYKQKKSSDGVGKVSIILGVEEIKKIFDNICDNDIRLLGFDPSRVHPKDFILTVFPVIPPCARPYVMSDGNICDDDLTYQILEIVKINNQLAVKDDEESDKKMTEQKRQKLIQSLKFRVSTLIDNSKGKAKHPTDSRPIKCLKGRLAGKSGQLRLNHMGKRVNYSARTVIGADPTLKLTQYGIPHEVAQTHTVPEPVASYNIEWLTEIVNSGKANFVITKSGKRLNLKYSRIKRGTELLYGDIIVRGNVTLEKGNDGKIIIPKPVDVVHITEDAFVPLEIGWQVVRKKKTALIAEKCKKKLKAGDIIVKGNVNLEVDGKIIIPDKVEVFYIIKGDEITLKQDDQLVRNGELIEIKFSEPKHIKLQLGDIVERHLQKGDIGLMNRQPERKILSLQIGKVSWLQQTTAQIGVNSAIV